VIHRLIASKIKNVTVSAIAGEWFVSAQTELDSEIRSIGVPPSASTSEAPS